MNGQAEHAEYEMYRHLLQATVDACSVRLYRETGIDRQLWLHRRNAVEKELRDLTPGDRSGYARAGETATEFMLGTV